MSAPRKGTRGNYQSPDGVIGFTVSSVEGNVCYAKYDAPDLTGPFIWRFGDGSLNDLHDWPGKFEAATV